MNKKAVSPVANMNRRFLWLVLIGLILNEVRCQEPIRDPACPFACRIGPKNQRRVCDQICPIVAPIIKAKGKANAIELCESLIAEQNVCPQIINSLSSKKISYSF